MHPLWPSARDRRPSAQARRAGCTLRPCSAPPSRAPPHTAASGAAAPAAPESTDSGSPRDLASAAPSPPAHRLASFPCASSPPPRAPGVHVSAHDWPPLPCAFPGHASGLRPSLTGPLAQQRWHRRRTHFSTAGHQWLRKRPMLRCHRPPATRGHPANPKPHPASGAHLLLKHLPPHHVSCPSTSHSNFWPPTTHCRCCPCGLRSPRHCASRGSTNECSNALAHH
mmetsp:Transcript_58067/g.186569  ORF Transcript_58067/g.186569 Transcript_58067/m.186569 type:complete len:225 (+) Transcript_58067:1211-1885(+)